MAVRHTVQVGDSLWGLAHRYLGSGTRYPKIVEEHNKEVTRFGQHSRLLPIKYKPKMTKDYTIETEMTGKISIENMTHDRYRHNFEIVMSVDKSELSSKLEFEDKALAELTKSVEPKFDLTTGKVTLKASIAAHANVGPYTFEVKADAPNHMSYTFKPKPISAIVEKGRRRYKYNAEIEFKVDVTLHPSPRNEKPQTMPAPRRENVPIDLKDSVGPVTVVGIIVAYILWVIYGPKGPILKPSPGLRSPFLHSIDPYDSRLNA